MARVLIVDDDATVRLYLGAVLEKAGHEVAYGADGEQAVEFFRRGGFDLAVIDLALPKKNGVLAIREILLLDRYAKVIAVTGSVPEQLGRAEEAGAMLVLEKPVEADDLLGAVAKLVRRSTGWEGVTK